MPILSLKDKYVDILKLFGDLEEVLEQAAHQYAVARIQAQIAETEAKVYDFEQKYGMSYNEFQQKSSTNEIFLDQLRHQEPLWEAEANEWEFYVEVLTEWHGRLNSLLH